MESLHNVILWCVLLICVVTMSHILQYVENLDQTVVVMDLVCAMDISKIICVRLMFRL